MNAQLKKEESVPWRETAKANIQKFSEQGLFLRGLRLREGLTQVQLAKELGEKVKQSHISEMERGLRPIGKNMAIRLSKILNTDYRIFL